MSERYILLCMFDMLNDFYTGYKLGGEISSTVQNRQPSLEISLTSATCRLCIEISIL